MPLSKLDQMYMDPSLRVSGGSLKSRYNAKEERFVETDITSKAPIQSAELDVIETYMADVLNGILEAAKTREG
ncbi:MAG: hypothetical protein AAGC95_08120 [Pseudomonadota bacterium]